MNHRQLEAKILIDGRDVEAAWFELGADFISGASQTPRWLALWQSLVNRDCLVAALYCEEQPVLILPLEIRQTGPLRIAIYAGGPHANCNFPAILPGQNITADALRLLFDALHHARPDIDLVSLTRQMGELGGFANPLIKIPSRVNANISLAITLDGNFETVLARGNAKRKKKKHRHDMRRFEDAGGFSTITATMPEETNAMLDNYFEHKATRLAQAGIKNTYEPAGVKDFFKQLFAEEAAASSPRFQLKALKVAGQYRAVLGKSYAADQTFIDFVGIAEDELVSTSPGEFLFFEDIAASCQTDLHIYSFGIGDEPYKRSWCDIELPTYDTDISLTAKGRIFQAWLQVRRKLVRMMKQNEFVWAKVKKLRSMLRGARRS
ncbi:CelD/BcsL family acetyltransferase involved in cellulose biosynthesis [Phyllobacterium ifriqiyense]|uniref:CelD/BcsL family acetyltransferase involved in cellulose biosynthesis n=1 Tax=Phyllobacterium ifriqiyense TaxID=314238 RepID=A0ABU0SGD0_9HYPH|nr:GNAT family N-acetyltransferase [Phyllobacterium ifriqiyense]MDQ0998783.1 CelD/BcsL family acetyltransferase involved in cellulose biosynthesis [Phyllobacterium ifriqiyense]